MIFAGDKTHVDMGNGLTGSSIYVDADVKSIKMILSGDIFLCPSQETHEILCLILVEIKEAADMASWDDMKMTRVDKLCVKDRVGEVGFHQALAIPELIERTFFRS